MYREMSVLFQWVHMDPGDSSKRAHREIVFWGFFDCSCLCFPCVTHRVGVSAIADLHWP